MKKKTFLLNILVVLITVSMACYKPIDNNNSVYYIAGYNVQSVLRSENGIEKVEQYWLVSENLKDTLATNNFPNNLFDFPTEIIKPVNICGFYPFPEKYRFAYKVKMTYKPMTEEEYRNAIYVCNTFWVVSPIRAKYVHITSISKIQ